MIDNVIIGVVCLIMGLLLGSEGRHRLVNMSITSAQIANDLVDFVTKRGLVDEFKEYVKEEYDR